MVIAFLFLSLTGGLAGASLAAFAGFGIVVCAAAYMAGGMLGTVGFLAFLAVRCHLPKAYTPPLTPVPVSMSDR